MPKVPILMPQLGESIAEATVVRMNVSVGDQVAEDQEIIEVETNKAMMGVTVLCGGEIKEIYAEEGVSYPVGHLLGLLEVSEEEATRTGAPTIDSGTPASSSGSEGTVEKSASKPDENVEKKSEEPSKPALIEPSVAGLPVPVGDKGAHYLSPRMKARMDELGLRSADISAIVGSGAGGRVTVEDLEKFLSYAEGWPFAKASSMRLAVSDAMRRSWTRPLASVGMPVPFDKLLDYRSKQNPKPGLTLYLMRALGIAIKEQPETAGFLVGEKVVKPRAFDIGVAIQVQDGVLVPVLRDLDKTSVGKLVEEYNDLVVRARKRQLPDEALGGGIATVTNFGTFGLTWGTPIPLPSETLILGMGAGVKKPRWSDEVEAFVPATEVELVLTFDHRVVDGGGAGFLLRRIGELLQKPEEL